MRTVVIDGPGQIRTSCVFTDSMALADAPAAYARVASRTADCVTVALTP